MNSTLPKARFWDNLIPLRAGLDGVQLAGWTPGPPVRKGLGCVLHADQMIPVAEGIALAADIYTPKQPGRYPAVVLFSAYSKELQASGAPTGTNEIGSAPVFTDRGYVHMTVTRRGMGRSQGESILFFNGIDVKDHAEVIAWAAAQPWCDGRVVLFGTSYFGITQAQVAAMQPPALKGFFSIEMCTDYFRQIVMFGGAPQTDFLTLWMGANFSEAQFKLRVPPLVRALASQMLNSPLRHWWRPWIGKRMTRLQDWFKTMTPTEPMRRLFASWVLDGKTRAANSVPAGPSPKLGNITVPFVVAQNPGHFNLHQFGGYDLFENAGTPRDRKWLIISEAEYELPAYHWQLEALAFFDHILSGAANGYAAQAPVRYWTEGANEFRRAADFPIPGSRPVRFYLASGGADATIHRLSSKAHETGENCWAAVPKGATIVPGFDQVANQLLSYEAAIDADVEFSGPVTANLRFSCNEIDSHVVARLGRIDRTGAFHLLSLGTIRPACRKIDTGRSTAIEIAIDIDVPQPLVPGESVLLRFSLTPQPVLLKAGERLRFDVGSRTDLLRSDVSHGHAQFDMQVPPYFSRNTVHYGPDSYVELSHVT